MTTARKNLHWSAIVGVACSFWLLLWLFLLLASLYDFRQLDSTQIESDSTGSVNYAILVGLLAMWAIYRAIRRLGLLRYGVLHTATITRRIEDSYDNLSGATNKITLFHYRYQLNGSSYSNMVLWAAGLKGKRSIKIVYNARNPDRSAIADRLRANLDVAANEWRSSMWHVVPRLILLVIVIALMVIGLLS